MKIKLSDLEYDEDFQIERAKELNLFKLSLDLPDHLEITGFTRSNKLLIREKK